MQLGIIRVNEGKQSVHGVLLGERERERAECGNHRDGGIKRRETAEASDSFLLAG